MFPETVEALSVVLEGYKNKLIQWTVDNLTLHFFSSVLYFIKHRHIACYVVY